MASPVKTSYDGLVVTDRFVQVHFKVGNGSWVRHAHIKVPITEFLTDEVTQAMDKMVRRRLIEIWSAEPVPDLFDADAPWGE